VCARSDAKIVPIFWKFDNSVAFPEPRSHTEPNRNASMACKTSHSGTLLTQEAHLRDTNLSLRIHSYQLTSPNTQLASSIILS